MSILLTSVAQKRPSHYYHRVNCPNCSQALVEVKASTNMGRSLILHQCPSCGGIWFDRWELYQTNDKEVDRLDPVNVQALRAPASLSDASLTCPKCQKSLSRFVDPLLPPDAHILRCPFCGGLWLNRGEFRRFEEYRKGRIASRPAPLPPEALSILAKNMAKKESWQKAAQWGDIFSADATVGKGVVFSRIELGDIVSTAVNVLLSLLL